MTKLLSIDEYAKHREVSRSTVERALKRSTITVTKFQGSKMLFDPEITDAQWDENTDPAKQPIAKQLKHAPKNENIPSFQESRAIKEAYAARIAKIDYEQKKSQLISAEKVKTRAIHTAQTIKNHMRQIPVKIAPALAAATDIHEIEQLLIKEIDEALTELSTYAE